MDAPVVVSVDSDATVWNREADVRHRVATVWNREAHESVHAAVDGHSRVAGETARATTSRRFALDGKCSIAI